MQKARLLLSSACCVEHWLISTALSVGPKPRHEAPLHREMKRSGMKRASYGWFRQLVYYSALAQIFFHFSGLEGMNPLPLKALTYPKERG